MCIQHERLEASLGVQGSKAAKIHPCKNCRWRLIKSPRTSVIIAWSVSALSAIAQDVAPDQAAELAKDLTNPVSSLITVPLQNNFDFRIGPSDEGWRYTLNIQPVIPISIGRDWNIIVRTIIPYVYQEDVFKGPAVKLEEDIDGIPIEVTPGPRPPRVQSGLSDTVQSFFLSPQRPVGGWIVGAGPVFLYPTATDDLLGSEKWGAGPTVVVLQQKKGWTYGLLFNHIWSFAGGESRRNVNATFLQPFLAYVTQTKTTFSLNTESTYNWNDSQWTVPINLTVAQLLKIGKLPVQLTVGGRYYAEGPSGAPEWGLRAVITFLFPTVGMPKAPAPTGK